MKKRLYLCLTLLILSMLFGCSDNGGRNEETLRERNSEVQTQADIDNEQTEMTTETKQAQEENSVETKSDVQSETESAAAEDVTEDAAEDVTEAAVENGTENIENDENEIEKSVPAVQEEDAEYEESESIFTPDIIAILCIAAASLGFISVVLAVVILVIVIKKASMISAALSCIENNVKQEISALTDKINVISEEINTVKKYVNNNNTLITSVADNLKSVEAAAADIDKHITQIKDQKTVVRTQARSKTASKNKCDLLNEFFNGKGALPTGLEIKKISPAGKKPSLNEEKGFEFYCEDIGGSINIYPSANILKPAMISFLGNNIIELRKSQDGIAKVLKPTNAIVSITDSTLTIVSKGIAEY